MIFLVLRRTVEVFLFDRKEGEPLEKQKHNLDKEKAH